MVYFQNRILLIHRELLGNYPRLQSLVRAYLIYFISIDTSEPEMGVAWYVTGHGVVA